MGHKVGLEVALNGNWERRLQPRVPVTVAELIEEGLACAQEGAAIIHFHAQGERSGAPALDVETAAELRSSVPR